jgi:hypothetical protein
MDEKLFFHLLDLTILNSLFCHFVGPRFCTILHKKPYRAGRPRSMATKADDIALRSNDRKERHVQMSCVFCFVLVINKIT